MNKQKVMSKGKSKQILATNTQEKDTFKKQRIEIDLTEDSPSQMETDLDQKERKLAIRERELALKEKELKLERERLELAKLRKELNLSD